MSTKKTGWEALDKWVGSGDAAAASAPAGTTTGWEALDKWVGSGDAAAAGATTGQTTGWEALDKWVSNPGSPTNAGSAAGGGFFGWLKRLFGGK